MRTGHFFQRRECPVFRFEICSHDYQELSNNCNLAEGEKKAKCCALYTNVLQCLMPQKQGSEFCGKDIHMEKGVENA